jgi:hemolysin activation/secretion protein
LQIACALGSLGSSRDAWLYSASIGNGFTFASNHDLLVSGTAERRVASTGAPMTQVGAVARYYIPQGKNTLFYAALSGDRISGGGVVDQLLLGGDTGLRGYKSRYQAGENRVLLSLEERAYTDWYPFRLFRVGGAAFFDIGRAWGGLNQNTANSGWLADVGLGLRIALDRASFANVLHVDIAVPLNRAPGIKAVQFVVKTEVTF